MASVIWDITASDSKDYVIDQVRKNLQQMDLSVVGEDLQRPWGGFWLIDEEQKEQFLKTFFPDLLENNEVTEAKLSPKILLVAPKSRLSWQEHQRRAEHWVVEFGPVGAMLSETDDQPEVPTIYQTGERILIPRETRHRLIGLDNWGVVAEVWQHTDPENPSNEDDIRQIQDDFGR